MYHFRPKTSNFVRGSAYVKLIVFNDALEKTWGQVWSWGLCDLILLEYFQIIVLCDNLDIILLKYEFPNPCQKQVKSLTEIIPLTAYSKDPCKVPLHY